MEARLVGEWLEGTPTNEALVGVPMILGQVQFRWQMA